MNHVFVKWQRLHPKAVLPSFKTVDAAGADVCAVEDVDIPAGEVRAIGLGFAVAIPAGYELQIRPRSGLALKHLVTVLNSPGTVDADYRGEVKVLLINHGHEVFPVRVGDRVAQVIFNKLQRHSYLEVKNLDTTARGDGGFGSTGRK